MAAGALVTMPPRCLAVRRLVRRVAKELLFKKKFMPVVRYPEVELEHWKQMRGAP